MGLVLLAGAAGLLGDGALATRELRADGGRVVVRHARVMRVRTPADLEVRLAGAAGDTTRLVLPAALLARAGVERVTPEAARVAADAAGALYVVGHAGAPRTGRVTVRLVPERPGRVRDTLRVDGAALPLELVVLP